MWVRMTYLNMPQDRMEEMRRIYTGEVRPVLLQQQGLIDAFMMEPETPADCCISCTLWESKEDAQAYEAGGTYARLLDTVRAVVTERPVLKSYRAESRLTARGAGSSAAAA